MVLMNEGLNLMPKFSKIIVLLGCVMLSGCNFDTREAGRSGTYQDDNKENPIREDFLVYKPALETSNKVLDLMKAGDSQTIANQYVLDEIKPLLTEKDIKGVIKKAEAKYGKIVSYKPMQWGFEPKVENGKRDKSEFNRILAEKYGDGKKAAKKIPVVFSVKVVQHEKALVNYWFQFPDDMKYDKLLGIFYKEKKGTRNIGTFN